MLNEEETGQTGHYSDFLRSVYPGLVARIGTRLGDSAAGEDVVQEALVRAWERTRSGEVIQSLPAWITTAALNLGRDRWRRRRTEEQALHRLAIVEPGLLEGIVPPDPDPGPDPGNDLAAHVAALPRRQREVVLLHYFADMRVEDVARVLGVGEGTVKQCLFRARQTLQQALGAPGSPQSGRRRRHPHPTTQDGRYEMKGWHKAGSEPREYEHGIDADERLEGKRVAFLRCTAEKPSGFGTVMQMIAADHYRGKRIRLSGSLRTHGLQGQRREQSEQGGQGESGDDDWAGLWMRVDGPIRGHFLAFDNMQTGKREIRGTTPWQSYAVVLDVAAEATTIGLGFLLSGAGEVRVAGLRLEEVGPDVPTTNAPPREYPKQPQNLDLTED